ncbi:glycerol-3-phosphate dehydrogenase/oxidase [Algoriphagus halophytocola]|uniref:Glycerol-3-phosphate dehydrogenase/oxidase n=1 Tax=Algoriphagus halophytocola TaxID=2991499 RepID=A0ABY6MBX3_9BACT|nr:MULTISPECIES: glycerol-3-phosphate dehydrogenase/oxidase [unclassified Algoriphagus]UZD21122.1 glycerol-3-phosphate dehydrogenase/oxidase [Algoriphagus sp. TR-M5]WBL42291.1 glycerol-3-phosphate dehydrogenase/oxidase [Algoriphagus sp. TR-M9]
MNRPENLLQLKDKSKTWDIAVIGGGSSGLGVALDAISRGLSVILFEKADFAKGTSSRSTKLVHGGVRYLAQGDVGLVFEALKERGKLLKNAPHLAHDQPFIIPIFTAKDRLMYSLGLKVYDWMSGRLSLGKSEFISKEETLKRLPGLKPKGLYGGVVYHDGQFDDARLAINLAQSADEMGTCVLNYVSVTSLTKNESGKITGLRVSDRLTNNKYNVNAKMVVNATGVFADKILKMDNPSAPKTIQPSQGIHIVLDQEFLGGKDALMIPKTKDGRVLFAVPWHSKLVVGTTDTLRDKPKLEPEALQKEIDFVLETAAGYLARKPTRADIRSVFAGLRPLARPKEGSTKTKEISRSHKVILSESGLVTITGGKWTTFRKMGEDTVEYFTRVTGEKIPESNSLDMKIHGATTRVPEGHWGIYGFDAKPIQDLTKENKTWEELLHPDFPNIQAEVIWAVREEMAVKVEDVLSRRIRLLVLDAQAAIDAAPKVADLMAKELGKDQDWVAAELSDFEKTAKKYLIKK